MWLCTNSAFLSIVFKDCAEDELLVRARRDGDIERVFPDAKVIRSTNSDYLYRAVVSRNEVATAMAAQIQDIDYGNFKSSVDDEVLHHAYLKVWQAMAALQSPPPYSGQQVKSADGVRDQRRLLLRHPIRFTHHATLTQNQDSSAWSRSSFQHDGTGFKGRRYRGNV